MGGTWAELPRPVLVGMHGSFVKPSDAGSGHPASRSHLCKGTIVPCVPAFPPSPWEGATCFYHASLPSAAAASRDCPGARVPPLPAPSQLQAKGVCARCISEHTAVLVPTASQAGGGCHRAGGECGEVSRPYEPFVQNHLPAPDTELGSDTAVAELERYSNGRHPSSRNIKATSCL